MKSPQRICAFLALLLACQFLPAYAEEAPNSETAAAIKKMWEVKASDDGFDVSTTEAIRSAEQVFASCKLEGLTKAEIDSLLSVSSRSAKYGYRAPFYPPTKDSVVFRFDNGNFGVQYDVVFDPSGKCSKVVKRGIE